MNIKKYALLSIALCLYEQSLFAIVSKIYPPQAMQADLSYVSPRDVRPQDIKTVSIYIQNENDIQAYCAELKNNKDEIYCSYSSCTNQYECYLKSYTLAGIFSNNNDDFEKITINTNYFNILKSMYEVELIKKKFCGE